MNYRPAKTERIMLCFSMISEGPCRASCLISSGSVGLAFDLTPSGQRRVGSNASRAQTKWPQRSKPCVCGTYSLPRADGVTRMCVERTLRGVPGVGCHFWREAALPAGRRKTCKKERALIALMSLLRRFPALGLQVRRHQPPIQEKDDAVRSSLREATHGPRMPPLHCLTMAS